MVCGGAGLTEARGGRDEARGTEGMLEARVVEELLTTGVELRVVEPIGAALPAIRISFVAEERFAVLTPCAGFTKRCSLAS